MRNRGGRRAGTLERQAAVVHIGRMSEQTAPNPIHPFSLEVTPVPGGGAYNWAIRRHGKLLQRSDRSFPSESKAHSSGMAAIEKLLSGADDR